MRILREKDKNMSSIEQICSRSIMTYLFDMSLPHRQWEEVGIQRSEFISNIIESIEKNKLIYLYGSWHRGIGKSTFIANMSKEYNLPIVTISKTQKRLFIEQFNVPEGNVFVICNTEDISSIDDKSAEFNKFADNENRLYALVDLYSNQEDFLEKMKTYFDEREINGTLLGFVSDDVQYRLK